MPLHSSLTGADLHEPKGIAAADADKVYVSNGSGSGVWQKVGINQIDTNTLPYPDDVFLSGSFADISTAEVVYLPVNYNRFVGWYVKGVYIVLQGAITLANSTVTVKTYDIGTTTVGTATVPFSGSAAGTIAFASFSSSNQIAGATIGNLFSRLSVETDGASSTAAKADFLVQLSYSNT